MNSFSAAMHGAALPARLLRLATSLFLFSALTVASLSAAADTRGSVAGAITSETTRNALQGATITVPALNRTEMTDSSGAFLLPNLPPGPLELVISYTGFADDRRAVTVRPGEVTRFESALRPAEAVLTMEAFTVATEREGAALLDHGAAQCGEYQERHRSR